jgi:hypothetical protein
MKCRGPPRPDSDVIHKLEQKLSEETDVYRISSNLEKKIDVYRRNMKLETGKMITRKTAIDQLISQALSGVEEVELPTMANLVRRLKEVERRLANN